MRYHRVIFLLIYDEHVNDVDVPILVPVTIASCYYCFLWLLTSVAFGFDDFRFSWLSVSMTTGLCYHQSKTWRYENMGT